jgi:hypothetical protein
MIDLDGIRDRDKLAYLPNPHAIHATGSIADRRALLAYVDELKRDAERYRWLRESNWLANSGWPADQLDATIDSAMGHHS